jgi:hypothetical protein
MSSEQTSTSAVAAITRRTEQAVFGIAVSVLGFLVFLIGAKPEWVALDRSPVVGFVQITVFTFGMGLLCLGGYVSLSSLWKQEGRSILADIGSRLIATGYVVVVFAGMADLFGLGTHPLPGIPFFGPIQATGVQAGQVMIAVGMAMMIPYHRFGK